MSEPRLKTPANLEMARRVERATQSVVKAEVSLEIARAVLAALYDARDAVEEAEEKKWGDAFKQVNDIPIASGKP